ncbi:hypothetical protein BS78_01G492100 [Paspalum vaginatum]|nr:hypothetical protein BS78_01G492100 [Paspalum vaginatum]
MSGRMLGNAKLMSGNPGVHNEYPTHRDQSRRACMDTLTEVISHFDYYKNAPDLTVQDYKMILNYLSEKCTRVIDHDTMLTPAPILQLTDTGGSEVNPQNEDCPSTSQELRPVEGLSHTSGSPEHTRQGLSHTSGSPEHRSLPQQVDPSGLRRSNRYRKPSKYKGPDWTI